MNLSELLKRREVEKVDSDLETAARLLKIAENNVKAAEDNANIGHYDVALSLAYNAMLNAGRALMAFKGYRASSDSHHKAVVDFCSAMLAPECAEMMNRFNNYRTRRHDIVYGDVESDSVGESEARNAVKLAKEFLGIIGNKIK